MRDNQEKVLDVTPGWLGCISMRGSARSGGIRVLYGSVLSFKGVELYSLIFSFHLMWVLKGFQDSISQLQKENSCSQNLCSLDGHHCVVHTHVYTYTHTIFMLFLVLCMSPLTGKSYLVPSRVWMETMANGCSVLSGFQSFFVYLAAE